MPKDDDEIRTESNTGRYLLLMIIGMLGLLAEAVGVGLLTAWWKQDIRSFTDPGLVIGGGLTLLGFIILIRGLAFLLKKIMIVLASPQSV